MAIASGIGESSSQRIYQFMAVTRITVAREHGEVSDNVHVNGVKASIRKVKFAVTRNGMKLYILMPTRRT